MQLNCQKQPLSFSEGWHDPIRASMSPRPRRVEEAGIGGVRCQCNPASISPEDAAAWTAMLDMLARDSAGARIGGGV